jgi:hypothetical protein
LINPLQSQVFPADHAQVESAGNYSDKNVNDNKTFSLSIAITGVDGNNYALTNNIITENTVNENGTQFKGSIQQLDSVTYIGAFGANWSNTNNWFNGAIPDLGNVAHVIIPTGKKVNFDQSTVELNGAMTSTIEINGQLSLQGVDISNTLSGSGAVVISGTQPTVIRGSNTYSGGTIIDANATLIAANDNALGLSPYISSSNGFFAMTDNILLPSLDVSGPITLMSNINTIGSQYYGVVRDATTGNIIRDTLINISNVSSNSDVTLTYLPGVANDYEFNVNNVGHFHSLTGDIKFTGTLNGDTSYRNFA